MEAIKNLRESSVLLSNTGFVSYSAFAKAIIYHPCLDSVEDGDVDVSDFENVKMVVENCARYACTDLLVALDKWAVEAEYRVIFDAMMSYRNGTNDEFFHSEHRDEEPSNNAPEEEQNCELSATMFNLNDDRSEEEKEDDILFEAEMAEEAERVLTPEEEEAAFDADVDFILDEESGKVKVCRDHTRRLTEEMYEEMERPEVDDNFHASLCEADCLPF